MLTRCIALVMLNCSFMSPVYAEPACGLDGVVLQVLGSGGPELDDQRASSGYLIWQDGKARLLIDAGSGSLLRFEQSDASVNDLEVILLSHLHTDHSADLPSLLKATYFSQRNRDLLIYGPTGNRLMPSLTDFVQALFGSQGAYRYLSDYLDGRESFQLLSHNVSAGVGADNDKSAQQVVLKNSAYSLTAVPVEHGPIPSLAWRVDIGGNSLVFSGDMTNAYLTLAVLAQQADLLVAHHAIAENAGVAARHLHMPPSVIGKIASEAGVKQLVLSHRMNRTLGQESDSLAQIRKTYAGPVVFADDLQCFRLPAKH